MKSELKRDGAATGDDDADGGASVDSDGDTAECLMSKMTAVMLMAAPWMWLKSGTNCDGGGRC